MAKSHDSIKKRNKELARKEKNDLKRQRKIDKKTIIAKENPEPPDQGLAENKN